MLAVQDTNDNIVKREVQVTGGTFQTFALPAFPSASGGAWRHISLSAELKESSSYTPFVAMDNVRVQRWYYIDVN